MSTPEEALLGLNVTDQLTEAEIAVKQAKDAERKAAKIAKKAEKAAKLAGKKAAQQKTASGTKGSNRDGMEISKSVDFGAWFSQLVTKTEMIEFYDISGCYILRPWSFAIWDFIRNFCDIQFKSFGVQNAYFPLFVSEQRLKTEESHIEGFAAEVAWVTKSGKNDLEQPIAVRPTSETIMYPAYAKWIRSHRDLPLKLNQWSNVVRWEFKYPTPFIRSREFLWQEGHTAFATKEEADKEVLDILEVYRMVYEDLLAVPVIKGHKSVKEKFAGGLYTTTIEGFIPSNGRAIQAATSHCLGQNFSKMFHIEFEAGSGGRKHVWQNSWGITTRSIGVMAMVHGDDKGLVLPASVAPIQVVIVPILRKGQEQYVLDATKSLASDLQKAGVRCKADDREDKNPGWKFNYWELKGVPLRLELGPRDIEAGTVMATRRYDGEKQSFKRDTIGDQVKKSLDEIQESMLSKARAERDGKIIQVNEWKDFVPALDQRTMVLAPWCERVTCEEDVKTMSGEESRKNLEEEVEVDDRALSGSAKTLCIPFEEEIDRLGIKPLCENTQCFVACGQKAKSLTLWGRSY